LELVTLEISIFEFGPTHVQRTSAIHGRPRLVGFKTGTRVRTRTVRPRSKRRLSGLRLYRRGGNAKQTTSSCSSVLSSPATISVRIGTPCPSVTMILGMKVLLIAVAHLILLAAIKQAEAAALRSGEGEPQQQQQQQQRSLIIGGTPAADLEFPFFVQARGVRFASQKSRRCWISFVLVASQMCPPLRINDPCRQGKCGGSLVAKDVVATAAHCAGTCCCQCGRTA
jgi:hypothetical protein